LIPIIDAWAIRDSVRRRFAFGPPRAFGSATFIVGNVAAGWLISQTGGEAALYWILVSCALTVIAAGLLPEGRSMSEPSGGETRKTSAWALFRNWPLVLALLASALLQGAHGFYYAFSTLAWNSTGISTEAVGLLWATGVGAEIVFFMLVGRFFGDLNPAWLLVLGGVASVVRWIVLAMAPPLWFLFGFQFVHAFSFGASYLGFLKYAAQAVPESQGATVQAINSALSGGIVLAAATFASGFAFSQLGVAGFAIMAVPAALGLVCALKLALRSGN
jgi:PPP family 3-phenylpropionic acid transporter